MWHNGVQLPKELSDLFVEISEIDDRLSILCAQKYVKVKIEPEKQGEGDENALPVTEDTPLPCMHASGGEACRAGRAEKAASDDPQDGLPQSLRSNGHDGRKWDIGREFQIRERGKQRF